jgi:hypothetical protein
MHTLQPLHRMDLDLQREVHQRRQRDDDEAGHDRHVELEALSHHEDRRELAERGKPAQPQDRIQPDRAPRMAEVGGGNFGHDFKA